MSASKYPHVTQLVTYFRATTGKRVPAQITAVTDVPTGTVNLRLADGTTKTGILRQTSRTGFNTWRTVRIHA